MSCGMVVFDALREVSQARLSGEARAIALQRQRDISSRRNKQGIVIMPFLVSSRQDGEAARKRISITEALLYAGARTILLVSLAMSLATCSSTPVSRTKALDARLDWPCDRLVVEWDADARALQEVVGNNITVRQSGGTGRLQLQVMQCRPSPPASRDSVAFSYAYVLIPVLGDSARIGVTGIPPDGWFWLQQVMADSDSDVLFANFDYDVRIVNKDFMTNTTNGAMEIAVRLKSADGCMAIDARTYGDPSSVAGTTALLSGEDGYASSYFGTESSQRFAATARVRIVGESTLPVSLGRLAMARVDRKLVARRVYWRVPSP